MAREKRTATDVQLERCVGTVPFKFRPGPQETLDDAANVDKSVLGTSADFLHPAEDILMVKDDRVDENACWDL